MSETEESKTKKHPYLNFKSSANLFNFRVSEDELEILNNHFEDVTGRSTFHSMRQFFWDIWSRATEQIEPVIRNKEKMARLIKENQTLLSDKDNLLEIIDQNKTAIAQAETTAKELQKENKQLLDEIKRMQENPEIKEIEKEVEVEVEKEVVKEVVKEIDKIVEVVKEKELSENQVLVELRPIEKDIAGLISVKETQRRKAEVPISQLLKDVFFAQALKGPGDHIYPYSEPTRDELKAIRTKHFNK